MTINPVHINKASDDIEAAVDGVTAGPSDAAAAVQARGVVKRFGADVIALNDVSVSINHNEFFTLLGPSGCGKTTLLRLIAGFEQPSAGDILLFGESIGALPPQRRPVNTVFQHYALFPHLSIMENIAFGLHMMKKSPSECREIALQMLKLVRMEKFAERKPAQLSGGQQQRIALARALAPRPKVLLLDEPLSALDLKLRQQMRLEIKSLQEQTGITFIFVTHDQEEALTMSERIAVMSNGAIQQIGTPLEIYERPANRFVMDFIGEANQFDATITVVRDGVAECNVGGAGHMRGVCSAADGSGHAPGDAVILAVRPEKVQLTSKAHAGGGNRDNRDNELRGVVASVIYLGTDTTYKIAITNDMQINARVQNRSPKDGHLDANFAIGDEVVVSVPIDSLRIVAH